MTTDMIMTVRGEVPASAIKPGGILAHQRVLEKESSAVDLDIAMVDLMYLREHPTEQGNLVLSNESRSYRELERLSRVQSNCVVDIHGRGQRDVARLKRLAEQLDLHILASTSLDLDGASDVAALTQQLVLDLQFGIDNSGIQASVIYQRMPAADPNPAILQAISEAQRITNAPVYFSFEPLSSLVGEVEAFLDQYGAHFGGNLHRVVLCHCDLWWRNPSALLRIAASTGVYLSFDLLGLSAVSDVVALSTNSWSTDVPRDIEIASCVQALLATHSSRILLSSTVTQTIQYHRCGGGGVLHALTSFKTRLFGPSLTPEQQSQWKALAFDNPLALLQGYVKPPPAAIPKDFLTCSICRKPFEPIVGEYFTKFEYIYCSTKCLRRHRNAGFASTDQLNA